MTEIFNLNDVIRTFSLKEEGVLLTTLELSPSIKAFDGHFPDHPLLPAIVQIQIVRKLLERHLNFSLQLKNIRKAKMAKMLFPNDIVEIEIKFSETSLILQEETQEPSKFLKVRAIFKKSNQLTTHLQLTFAFF